jgi:hypothetical protein
MAMIKGDAKATKAYRDRKQKALAATADKRKATDRRKAQINKTEAK